MKQYTFGTRQPDKSDHALTGRKLNYSERRQEWLNWAEQEERAARVVQAEPEVLAAPAALAGRAGPVGRYSARSADAYANPIMVDALILGREGTTLFPKIRGPHTTLLRAGIAAGIDDPPQMERWEPWVRAYTAIGEMLQGIGFQTSWSMHSRSVSSGTIPDCGNRTSAQTTFEAQIPMVLSWAELRNERATEIMAQIDPQYAFWSSIIYMHPDRTKRTFELINMVLQFCVYVEMRFKHALACWRPVEYNAQVQPMITTPGHGSLPERTRDAGPCGSLRAEKAAESRSGDTAT